VINKNWETIRYISKIKKKSMKNIRNYSNFSLNEMDLDSSSNYPMEQNETLTSAIRKSMRSKKPVLLSVAPEDSPAAEAAQSADSLGATLICIDAPFMDPMDFGIPAIGGGIVPPSFLPYGSSKDPIILLFDNVNRTNRQVLQSVMKLASTRRLGEYTLPENCIVVLSTSSSDGLEVPMRSDKFITVQA